MSIPPPFTHIQGHVKMNDTVSGSARQIVIDNLGPITHLVIPVPEDGGVIVLKGQNGVGKTHALAAVENSIRGVKSDLLHVKDGELKGTVECLGVKLTVARNLRRSGELEVQGLDGRLNIADLVDPGLKDPEAADSQRIKSIVSLSGMQSNADDFKAIFGGDELLYRQVVSESSTDTSDVVEMARRVKRDCDAAALGQEKKSETYWAKRGQLVEAASIVVPEDITPENMAADQKRSAFEGAVKFHQQLVSKATEHDSAMAAAKKAQDKIDQIKEAPFGESAEDWKAQLVDFHDQGQKVADDIKVATEHLAQLRRDYDALGKKELNALHMIEVAVDRDLKMDELKAQVSANIPPKPDQSQLDFAKKMKDDALTALQRCTLIADAKRCLDEAKDWEDRAKYCDKLGERLRDIGKRTDEVISSKVQKVSTLVTVSGGRLITETAARGKTYFHELSPGEKWRCAIDIAVNLLGEGCLLVLPQSAWQEMDPIRRTEVADYAREKKVLILTAICTEDEEIVAEFVQ